MKVTSSMGAKRLHVVQKQPGYANTWVEHAQAAARLMTFHALTPTWARASEGRETIARLRRKVAT